MEHQKTTKIERKLQIKLTKKYLKKNMYLHKREQYYC